MSKFHNHPEKGPQPCRADSSKDKARGCPFGSEEEHYESKAEAQAAFEKTLEEAHGSSSTIVSDSKVEELRELVASLPEVPTLEEVQELGEAFNKIVEERLDFDPESLEELTGNNWGEESKKYLAIGEENARLVKELFETGGMENKLAGNKGNRGALIEATELLPAKAVDRVKGTINLRVEPFRSRFGGTYMPAAKVIRPIPMSETMNYIPKGSRKGDYVYDGLLIESNGSERLISAGLQKIVRAKGEPLVDGESAKQFVDTLSSEKQAAMLKSGLVDTDFRIKEGKAAEFEQAYPKMASAMKMGSIVESYHAGRKPKYPGGRTYRKVAEKVDIIDQDGVRKELDLPLYRAYEPGVDYSQHTITAERGASPSVMLHEFSHAVQATGVPKEGEFFRRLSEGADKKKTNGVEHYVGGPDDYMLKSNGREVFTRATEGFFYPRENPYLYGSESSKNHGKEVRDWVAGAWLSLGR